MKIIIPIISIAIAAGIFFGPTVSALDAVKPLVARRTDLSNALENSKQLQTLRGTLQEKYNSFRTSDLGNLQKMIPSHVDNVRLTIDINGIASSYGMILKNVEVEQGRDVIDNPGAGSITGEGPEHLDLHFTVSGSYESMKLFMKDLSRSLRIVDVIDMTFSAKRNDIYDFSVGLRTYWLQDK